ncbi:MAG: tetratricopeptide repeat protein [Candidatus Kapaibacteriota bacterium]
MRFFLLITMFLLGNVSLYSQGNLDQFKRAIEEKEYVEALRYTPEVVLQHTKDNAILMMAADVYMEMELPDSAVSVLSIAMENDDESPFLNREYAIALSKVGKINVALSTMSALLKRKKMEKDPENFVALSNIYLNADSVLQAEYNLLIARDLDDKNAQVYIGLGDLYFAKKVYELAKDNYEAALASDGKQLTQKSILNAKIKLASSYYKLGNMEMDQQLSNEYFRRSLNTWNEITKADPKNATAFYEQGKIFFLASKFLEAGASFNRYALLRPEGWLGRWYAGQAWYNAKKYDSALIHLEVVRTKIDTITEKANAMLAHSYFEAKKFSESIALYKSIPGLNQTDYERMGYAAFFSKDTVTAIDAFYKSINGEEKKCNTAFRFANLLQSMKKYDEAISVFRKRIADCEDSNSVKSRYFIGSCYYLAQKYDSALISLKEYLSLDGNSISGRVYIGNTFNAMKKSDSAKKYLLAGVELAQQALNQNPGNPSIMKESEQAFEAICRVSLEAKDVQSVIKYGKAWLEINDKSAIPHVYLGFAYQTNGDKDNACKAYSEALKRDPKNSASQKNKTALGCQ